MNGEEETLNNSSNGEKMSYITINQLVVIATIAVIIYFIWNNKNDDWNRCKDDGLKRIENTKNFDLKRTGFSC